MCTHTRSSTPCHPPSLTHTPYLRKCCIAAIPMKSEETSVHLNIYQPGPLEGTVCIHVTFSPLLPSWYSLWVSFYLLSIQMSQQTSGSSQSPPCMTVARGQGEQLRHLLLPIDFPVLPLLGLGAWGFSAHVYLYVLCLNVMKQVMKSISHGTSTIQACCFSKCKIRMGNSLCP